MACYMFLIQTLDLIQALIIPGHLWDNGKDASVELLENVSGERKSPR